MKPWDPNSEFAVYPENYFQYLAGWTGLLAAQRLQDAVWSVANFWTQAWEDSRMPAGGRQKMRGQSPIGSAGIGIRPRISSFA